MEFYTGTYNGVLYRGTEWSFIQVQIMDYIQVQIMDYIQVQIMELCTSTDNVVLYRYRQ